jgi:hypothetical protein
MDNVDKSRDVDAVRDSGKESRVSWSRMLDTSLHSLAFAPFGFLFVVSGGAWPSGWFAS